MPLMKGHTGPLFNKPQSQQASVLLLLHRGLTVPLTLLPHRTAGHQQVGWTTGEPVFMPASNSSTRLFFGQKKHSEIAGFVPLSISIKWGFLTFESFGITL